MSMPINHKPAILPGQLNEGLLIAQSVGGIATAAASKQQLTVGSLAATPVGGNMLVSDDNTQNIIVTPTPLSSVDSLASGKASSWLRNYSWFCQSLSPSAKSALAAVAMNQTFALSLSIYREIYT